MATDLQSAKSKKRSRWRQFLSGNMVLGQNGGYRGGSGGKELASVPAVPTATMHVVLVVGSVVYMSGRVVVRGRDLLFWEWLVWVLPQGRPSRAVSTRPAKIVGPVLVGRAIRVGRSVCMSRPMRRA
jgi:hypothetical protein